MPARVKAPGREWLADRISEGLTDQQMADRWLDESDELISRQGINRIVRLYELRPRQKQYGDVIPWAVKKEHVGHWYHKMLYAEGHRRQGKELDPEWESALNNFLQRLKDENAVVAYLPDSPDGFYLTKRQRGEELITERTRS